MTLLKDLIYIPEHVQRGDFVLKLAEGVERGDETLRNYVFTDQLRTAFDQALVLVKTALEGRESKAAFLHGSFGSGKSHFLAVLHLLLSHNPSARAHPDLAPLVQKHSWLSGKKFLLVPFHMIGAESLEHAVFGQYLAHVGKLHPKAPVPAVFLGEPVFEQADRHREMLGDEKFFAALSSREGGGDGWGDLGEWNAESYLAARRAQPGDPERDRLVSRLVEVFLPAYSVILTGAGNREGFLPIDQGLAVLSQHAKALGYDAILFFLDEVVLWLASRISDPGFVNREGPKLSKLVEFQKARALPVVSLLARQRDLRELVGEHQPGADKLSALDALKYWEDRFSTIKLEDRNLPVIVQKRILQPRSETAVREIDAAFAETKRQVRGIQDILRTSSYRDEDFRLLYPFSPALVQSLVAVSSVLQRERTAIRVLLQLLVERRDTLELGSILPVGDLFDAIADGDEPFSEGMRAIFEGAKKLYREKLRPRLCQEQGLTWEALEALPPKDQKRDAFRRDDRIVKTLLLSVLAPEVEALKGLTAQKIVALNHGTYRSLIPGQEVGTVLAKLRRWQPDVPEIHIEGDHASPTIQLRIHGVDTSSILEKVANEDNAGNRRSMVRAILFDRLGIEWQDTFENRHTFEWRGTKRQVVVVYGNVRELPAASLRSRDDEWKLVIDFPFDEPGHEPLEDLAKLQEFRNREGSTRTVCWLPAFLSTARQNDLGTLVRLEYAIKTDARFHELAGHLPPAERSQAKAQLTTQRDALKARIVLALEAAYGIGKEEPDMLGPRLEVAERFQCLDGGRETLSRPAVGTLRDALKSLCDQMLSLQYPKHPVFSMEIKASLLKRAFEWIQRAARADLNRVVVDKDRRPEVKAVVEPLGLGTLPEDALVLGTSWAEHFEREAAHAKVTDLTVGHLRAWTDKPEARGLPTEVQNLLILTYAERENRRFLLHGGAYNPTLEKIDDAVELRPQALPSAADYAAARDRAARAFGLAVGEVVGATNVGDLIDGIQNQVRTGLPAARELVGELRKRLTQLGIPFETSERARTATTVVTLLEALDRAEPAVVVARLANATVAGSWEAFGTSFKQSDAVRKALADARWESLEPAFELQGPLADEGKKLRQDLVSLLTADELVAPLPAKLRLLESRAAELTRKALQQQKPAAPEPPVVPPVSPDPQQIPLPTKPPVPPRLVVVDEGARPAMRSSDLQNLVTELARKVATGGRRTITISWRIEEERP